MVLKHDLFIKPFKEISLKDHKKIKHYLTAVIAQNI